MDSRTNIRYVKGVGPALARKFKAVGVETVGDLLEYYPRDWIFASKPVAISSVEPGQTVCVRGTVESAGTAPGRGNAYNFHARIGDGTGRILLNWFGGSYLRGQIQRGHTITAYGPVYEYGGTKQITSPRFVIGDGPDDISGPIYPATKDLPSVTIRRIVESVLTDPYGLAVDEYEYDHIALELLTRNGALYDLHRPAHKGRVEIAKQRLKFDELLMMQLGLAIRRHKTKELPARPYRADNLVHTNIEAMMPFKLTAGQKKAAGEIAQDLCSSRPMNRMLQGDVGSGKTAVAIYAALLTIMNNEQVAIMAPTTILARQWIAELVRFLGNAQDDIYYDIILGSDASRRRRHLHEDAAHGYLDILVGTTAMLEEKLKFKRLGLVIVDEQHRFGVEQRAKLCQKQKTMPNCLVMSATPIPRTLAMTAFGDLDVSTIKDKPPGRGSITTVWYGPDERQRMYALIAERLKWGRQAYVISPRIEGNECGGGIYEVLREYEAQFSDCKISAIHGQLDRAEIERRVRAFRDGAINILVSTTIVEVGVDVPNATIMVIEGADRFGLAQLHQLRGRIGRGPAESCCILFAEIATEEVTERLNALVNTQDGFEIAEQDLRLRGPGELFSPKQHGLPDLKLADLIDDYDLLVQAKSVANELIGRDPKLLQAPALRHALQEKFGDALDLGGVA